MRVKRCAGNASEGTRRPQQLVVGPGTALALSAPSGWLPLSPSRSDEMQQASASTTIGSSSSNVGGSTSTSYGHSPYNTVSTSRHNNHVNHDSFDEINDNTQTANLSPSLPPVTEQVTVTSSSHHSRPAVKPTASSRNRTRTDSSSTSSSIHQSSSSSRTCWICLDTDQDTTTTPHQPPREWVHACNCTLVAHSDASQVSLPLSPIRATHTHTQYTH